MSEEKKIIYCTQCGSGNDAASKFCSNCGAKLSQPEQQIEESTPSGQEEGVFSGEDTAPVYEKITDAEEEKPVNNSSQDDIQINYGTDQNYYNNSTGSNTYYDPQQTQYYSGEVDKEPVGGGNIGIAIASLVCGILSLLCCCLGLFSAILAIAAVVLGIITLCFKYDGRGMAIAGIATGAVALVILILAMILSSTTFYTDMVYDFFDEFNY